MKIKLIEKPTFKIRGNSAIVIFPSRPYWFAATKDIVTVLNIFEIEIDKKSVIEKIKTRLGVTPLEASETFEEIVNLLWDNGVLLINDKISDSTAVFQPQFQVNKVENVLVIAATQECNLLCKHCYANARKPLKNEMTTKDLKQLIDDLASMPWKNDVSRIGLTGGEFFIRPDALEIIDYIHTKGFKVLISSNGLLITDEIVSRLANYKNLKISISLDGPTAKVHEIIRGKGTFEKTISTIKKLTSKGIFVGVNMLVYQDNINFIEQTLQLAVELEIKSFNCLNLMWVGRANSQNSRNKLIRVSDYRLYKKLFEILKKNSTYQTLMINSTFANQIMGIAGGVKSHYCGIGTNRALYVRADGNIYPCPDTVLPKFLLGNIKKKKLEDIWENSSLLHDLRQLDVDNMNPICAECNVRYFCGGGCRGENYQVTQKLQSPHFNCKEIKKTIIEVMWMLTEDPSFFQNKVENLYQKACV